MAYDLEEQESIDQMKAWWERWGTPVTAAVCVLCFGFAGWNGWQWWERNEAAKAGVAYIQLQNAVFQNDSKNVSSISAGIIDHYGSTVYAPLAALASAQAAASSGDFAGARASLRWVIEKSDHPEYATIARVRLAGVDFDEGKLDDALKTLSEIKDAQGTAFTLVADRMADVYRAKGDVAKAREWLEKAKAQAAADDPLLRIVELKLGSLPVES